MIRSGQDQKDRARAVNVYPNWMDWPQIDAEKELSSPYYSSPVQGTLTVEYSLSSIPSRLAAETVHCSFSLALLCPTLPCPGCRLLVPSQAGLVGSVAVFQEAGCANRPWTRLPETRTQKFWRASDSVGKEIHEDRDISGQGIEHGWIEARVLISLFISIFHPCRVLFFSSVEK